MRLIPIPVVYLNNCSVSYIDKGSSKPSSETTETNKKPKTTQEQENAPPGFFKRALKRLARTGIGTFKWVGILGLLSFAAIKTPGSGKVVNEICRFIGTQPSPLDSKVITERKYINDIPVDRFVSNYKGYSEIEASIKDAKIQGKDIDLDDSKVALDNTKEIRNLIFSLKAAGNEKHKNAISLLTEINKASQAIWGPNGPNPYNLIQAGRPNCQVMAALQSSLFTTDNIQALKSKVTVTDFNPSKENFKLNINVELNGETIPVPYKVLKVWMSPQEIAPSYSKDHALYVPLFTYAIDKVSAKHDGIPSLLPSSSVTTMTGDNYCTVLTTSLSDEALIEVLSKAPNTPTGVAIFDTKQHPVQWSDLAEFFNWLTTTNSASYSEEKANEFTRSTQHLLEQSERDAGILIASLTNDIIGEIALNSPTRKKGEEKDLLACHIYAVKEFKKVDNEYITTITDSHGTEFDLTLAQIRNNTIAVISKSDNFPNVGSRGLIALIIAGGGIALIRIGANKLKTLVR